MACISPRCVQLSRTRTLGVSCLLFNFAGEEEEWVSVIRRQFEIDEAGNERCNDVIFVPQKAVCDHFSSTYSRAQRCAAVPRRRSWAALRRTKSRAPSLLPLLHVQHSQFLLKMFIISVNDQTI